jgi:DNA-binding response OmpR family regulator
MQPPIVLCLDDDEALLCLLEKVLDIHGYVALPATNGREALQLAATQPFDAAILDYGLPDMTGGEVAREVKRIRPDIPVLVFSGACDIPPSDVSCADAIVSKSEGMNVLLARLKKLMHRSAVGPPAPRRFRRYPVQLPFAITAERSGELQMYRGLTTDIGEGGIGGKVEGDLAPSECVLLQVLDSRLGSPLDPRARIRYRNHETYGFEFIDCTPQQRAQVRRLCTLLAPA